MAYDGAFFGVGRGPILYNEVSCTGNEEAFLDCTASSGDGMCTHAQDAGVECAATIGEFW